MLKLIKWLVGLLVTLTIIVLLAVIIVPNVVDPNDYREDLSVLVKNKTGRELSLDGDLEISVFPWLGVKTQGLSLSQPEGIEGNMLSVANAQLRVKFAPLLSKKVEVDTVILEQPMIKLVTLKNGLDSFSGLSDDSAEEVDEDSAKAAVALAIQGVELTDGTVLIDDRQAGSVLELSNLNLETGNLIGTSLADVKASGQVKDSNSPDTTNFELRAKALIDTDTLDVQVSDLISQVKQGEFEIDLSLDAMTFQQSSQIDASGLNVLVRGEHAIEASIPQLSANLDTQAATIKALSANYHNIEAVISELNVTQFVDQPSATGRLSVPAFDARELIEKLNIDFQPSDSRVLKSVGLEADFAGNLDGALIKDLVVNLDDSALTGSASVVNFEKPKLKFDLNLTELNLDSYLPEDTEEDNDVSGGEALIVPMAAFKDIDANGSFKAAKLVSGGVALTDIDVVVKSTPGNVTITPRAKLYDGKLGGEIAFNNSGAQSSLTVKNNIDLVQLSPLLNDAIDSDMLRGIGTLGLDLLVTEVNGKQSNQGTIKLLANKGALSGIDVYNIIGKLNNAANLYSSFSGDQQPQTDDAKVVGNKSDSTEFSELLGTFYLNDFLMTNDDLKFKGPGFEITGAGQFDLEKENMDYNVNLVIQDNIAGVGGEGIRQLLGPKLNWLAGKQIPVRCTGSFESPTCLPDVKALYSFYLSSKLDEKKAELVQEKLGIEVEEGKKVRTKDIFKQLILKEALKDDNEEQGLSESGEVPIGERDEEANSEDGQAGTEPTREKTKKELREERKRKILESIFD